jgi:hypothetical protein
VREITGGCCVVSVENEPAKCPGWPGGLPRRAGRSTAEEVPRLACRQIVSTVGPGTVVLAARPRVPPSTCARSRRRQFLGTFSGTTSSKTIHPAIIESWLSGFWLILPEIYLLYPHAVTFVVILTTVTRGYNEISGNGLSESLGAGGRWFESSRPDCKTRNDKGL